MTNSPTPKPIELRTPSPTDDRLEALRELIPEAFSEGRVDFDRLRAALGDVVDERPERYSFTWAGKRDAIRLLQTSSSATLVPAPEESVNWDTTQHLFIEGDNLEVLKLLYKAYFGRVKLIYIDPPYNTGNDFVYPDDFADPLGRYLEITGQKDAAGNLLTSNPETSGRYHSAWLNMMYPRLFMARQLLRTDGVIFVSIGEAEVHNLQQLLNEIFGEENFITMISRLSKTTSFRSTYFAPSVDYILCYGRDVPNVPNFADEVDASQFPKTEAEGPRKGEKYRDDLAFYLSTLKTRPNQRYYIECPDGSRVIPPGKTFPPDRPKPGDGVWRWAESVFQQKKGLIVFKRTTTSPLIDENGNQAQWNLYTKSYLSDRQETGTLPRNYFDMFLNRIATSELKDLGVPFEFSKPYQLIEYLIRIVKVEDNDIVLDFFAGSSPSAQAVFSMNRKAGISGRFVMVQLPELTDVTTDIYKAGYRTVADIGKERVRRVIAKMQNSGQPKLGIDIQSEDLGFRVFKLAPSALRAWRGTAAPTPDEYVNQLALLGEPLRDGWRAEDVVWEVAIKEGFPLTSRVTTAAAGGQQVYRVEDPDSGRVFHVCLDDTVSADVAAALGLESGDLLVVRDAAVDDTTAANLALQCRLKTL